MTRTAILIIIFLFPFALLLKGQAPSAGIRCSTVEYNKQLQDQYPELAENYKLIERGIRNYLISHHEQTRDLVVIPTIVHVLWNTPEQNIPDDQIWSQIFVLNEDFRRLNSDTIHTPDMFKPVAADCQIEFCLARRAPGDTANTYGILRKYTDVTEFAVDNQVKNPFEGGSRAWDPEHYLNIWVCNLAGNYLGYSQYPGGPDSTDGVVIDYKCFGKVGDLNPHYNKGRTATHEIGHWLDLLHIWGDDFGSCDGSDYVDDTPNAADANYYCPNHPHTSVCNSTAEMFMNYMDYCDDICFNLFTAGQRDRMMAAIVTARPGLLTSDGCIPYDAINEVNQSLNLVAYPNPANNACTLDIDLPYADDILITINDVLGNFLSSYPVKKSTELHIPIDLSGMKNGMYFIHVRADDRIGSVKLTVLHEK